MTVPQLIKCGNHQMAPWCICCSHLISGESKIACAVPNPHIKEVDYDWLCPSCLDIMEESDDGGENLSKQNLIHCVCIHCMNHLLKTCKKEYE